MKYIIRPTLTPETVPQRIRENTERIRGCPLERFVTEHARTQYEQMCEAKRASHENAMAYRKGSQD